MSSTPQFNGEQLAVARSERWHQGGDALLTLEAAREWVGELGMVLFAPRTQQLATPAPSLVEATLGRAVSAPTAAESETARGLVARMVAEGSAVPLNLLGGPGDVPDFVVSAQIFGYVFTLRGDKSWKQPPATSGAQRAGFAFRHCHPRGRNRPSSSPGDRVAIRLGASHPNVRSVVRSR